MYDESEFVRWIYWVGGMAAMSVVVVLGWLWKTEWRRCRRCRERAGRCYCMGGAR
jgi:hypothetical protein